MNLRPSGYEPDELPGCSTPRRFFCRRSAAARYFLRLSVLEEFVFSGRTGLLQPATVCTYWCGVPEGLCRTGVFASLLSEVSLFRSGGDLLSHVLRRSTIGVGTLIGRVRDGIGSFVLAMTTRPEKRPGTFVPKHQFAAIPMGNWQPVPGFVTCFYVLLTIRKARFVPCCYRIRSSQSGN